MKRPDALRAASCRLALGWLIESQLSADAEFASPRRVRVIGPARPDATMSLLTLSPFKVPSAPTRANPSAVRFDERRAPRLGQSGYDPAPTSVHTSGLGSEARTEAAGGRADLPHKVRVSWLWSQKPHCIAASARGRPSRISTFDCPCGRLMEGSLKSEVQHQPRMVCSWSKPTPQRAGHGPHAAPLLLHARQRHTVLRRRSSAPNHCPATR